MIVPAVGFIEEFITIAFVLIAFVSWIIRLINQSREQSQLEARRASPRARPAAGNPTRDSRNRPPPASRESTSPAAAQSQIDEFLKQSAGNSSRSRPGPSRPAGGPAGSSPEGPPARRLSPEAAPEPRASRAEGSGTDWDHRFPERREQLTSAIADRHLAASAGSELRERLDEVMAEAALVESQRDQAQQELAQQRQHREDVRQEEIPPSSEARGERFATGTRSLATLFKNRRAAREAIVINAVLGPPPALQRSSQMPGRVRAR